MTTSKIKKLTFSHEWSNSFGANFDHFIEFENSESGIITTKKREPSFSVGDSFNYDTFPPAKNGKPNKIKKAQDPKYGGGQAPNKEATRHVSDDTMLRYIGETNILKSEIADLKEVVKQLVIFTKMPYKAPQKEQPKVETKPRVEVASVSDDFDNRINELNNPYPDDDLPF